MKMQVGVLSGVCGRVVVSRADEEIPVSAALAHPIGQRTIEDWLAAEQPEDGSRLELISAECSYLGGFYSRD
jgi:hypothetical protein